MNDKEFKDKCDIWLEGDGSAQFEGKDCTLDFMLDRCIEYGRRVEAEAWLNSDIKLASEVRQERYRRVFEEVAYRYIPLANANGHSLGHYHSEIKTEALYILRSSNNFSKQDT